MYEQYFGLRERPFELTPDPRYLLLTPGHREALSNLEYGIIGRKPITLLTGEAGTGKTTLLRRVLRTTAEGASARPGVFVHLNNPKLDRREFVEYLASGFRLPPEASSSKARFLLELERMLIAHRRAEIATALIVDEAQAMPDELLEEIRLLVNIESDREKYLPVLLVGQPELADRLNGYGLRQLKQRVALRCHLAPLTVQETGAYIATRLKLAGAEPSQIFTRQAVLAIFQRSRGIPRTINVLADNALVSAYAQDRRPVDADIVSEVGADFDFPVVASLVSQAPAPPPVPVPPPLETEEAQPDRTATFEGFQERRWSLRRALGRA